MHTHPDAENRCNGFRRRCFRRASSACFLRVGLVAILAATFALPALESAAQDVEDLTSRIGENTEEAAVEALVNRTGEASPLSLHPGVVAITMSGGRRRYQGFRGVVSWKGYETSGYAVVNGYFGHGLVGGLGLGRVIGSADLDGQIPGQMPVPFTAVLEYGTTSVFPGLGWRWAPGSGLWAALGYSEGEIELNRFLSSFGPPVGPQQSDVAQRAVAVGASVRLFSVGAAESGRRMTLTLRSIALSSRFESAGNNDLLQKRTQDGHRLGLALKSAGTFDLASGVLMPQVQVGVNQRDTGKENFTYLKLAGALAYTLPRWDLTVSVNVNTMLAHEKKDRNLCMGASCSISARLPCSASCPGTERTEPRRGEEKRMKEEVRRKHRPVSAHPAIIVLLALMAVLGGCDSDRAPTSEQAPAIKVGFISVGERPTYLRSAQLAVDEVNAHGGLLGRPVELVSLVNTEASLPLSVRTAEDMIVDDRVSAIIGPNRSTHAVEVGPIAQRYGVPMVTTAASNPRVTEAGEFVFMASVTDTFQGRVMAQFATTDLGVRTVALLTLRGDVYTEGISEFFAANFEDLGGVVVADEFFDAGTTDFTAQLAAIAALKPDAFFVSSFIQEIADITRQARAIPMRNAAGEPTLFLGTDTWDSEILLADEEADLEGSFFTTHFSPDTNEPAARAFIEAYEAAYGALPTGGDAVNYDAARLLFEAIERAGSLDPEAIREQLQATEDYVGGTRIARYDANRHPVKSSVILTIRDGEKRFHRQIDPPLRGHVVMNDTGTDAVNRWGSDAYKLNVAAITDDTLTVTVSYGGGCADHDFTLVTSGAFMESDPVQIEVFMAHDANGDRCKAYLTEAYAFDLVPIKTLYQEAYREDTGTIVLLLRDVSENVSDLIYAFGP